MAKRFLAVFLAVLLLASMAVQAYAAEPYDSEWVPPFPEALEVNTETGAWSSRSFCFTGCSQETMDFVFNCYAEGPNLVLLDQGVYNRYNEENGIGYDRQFSLYFVKPDKKPNGEYYNLGYFQHNGGPHHQEQMNTPSPMRYGCYEPHSFVKAVYDVKSKQFYFQPSISHLPGGSGSFIRFTYVLSGNTLCQPSDVYPYFSAMNAGKWDTTPTSKREMSEFEVSTIYNQFVDGEVVPHYRDYDWWIGIKGTGDIPPYNENLDVDQDVDGDGKPDHNVDTNGDGKPEINIDTDGDGKPDLNIDTDGDRKPDLNIDTDSDGKPDVNLDTDGDGAADLDIDTNGDGKPDLNIDTNGDKKPDLNVDTDGDRRPDLNIDTNGDGKPDLNIDTNGDGKADLNIDTNGDGKADANVDIDGDGKPDVNIQPGGGSGGGSSSSGSGEGSSGSGSESGPGSGSGGSESGGGEGEGGGDSGGGSSSDKGSGPPDTWFRDDEDKPNGLDYYLWSFFDPYKYQYKPFDWDKDYDPLEGYDPGQMPDFPHAGDPNYGAKDPFDVPNDIKFKDFAIEFEGGE